MKFCGLAVFSTLVLSGYAVAAIEQGEDSHVVVEAQGDVIGNNSAVADGGNVADQIENQDQTQDNAGQNNNNDNNNIGQLLNGTLGDSFNDINIDPNDIEGSLGQNILDLLLSMGICNFDLGSLGGLGLGNEIQLLIQLQQLQQLQALGIVNSFTVDQLIQREILSQTFNLNIIKRSIDASVKQATRGRKRTVMLRRQCANVGRSQGGK
ncbi:hypothetical protein F5Y07DRAFT_412963 [Xylaria sp. FL0933]|nr:hypothetical protein F5Y07DRAFT_412963 [Xylaria sp. FL0933]